MSATETLAWLFVALYAALWINETVYRRKLERFVEALLRMDEKEGES